MKQKIVFFGSGKYTIPIVGKLMSHGLNLVISNDRNLNSELLKFCKDNNIPFIIASTSTELIKHNVSIIDHSLAILASYGAFIPQSIIDGFVDGIINVHPSLLPKYKGPSPIQYALLNGETITGVTLIKLDNEIDHGPILSQKPYNLSGNETSKDLLSILFEIGAEMVEELVIKLENGEKLKETPQDHLNETWSLKLTRNDGFIDLSAPQFKISNFKFKINDMIRAYYPWPGVWFISRIKNQELRIKLLPENRIQVEGKNSMDYRDFINGFGDEGKSLLLKLKLI